MSRANHGLIVTGATLERARALTIEAETLVAMSWRALLAGEPVILPDAETERVRQKFATYGSYGTGKTPPRG